jgi:hypothetical protein
LRHGRSPVLSVKLDADIMLQGRLNAVGSGVKARAEPPRVV